MNLKDLYIAIFSNLRMTETKKIISKNFFWLLTQNAVKLVFGVSISLYLARFLGPEDFGIYSFAISIISFLLLFTNLGIDPILIRELVKNNIEENKLMGSSFNLKLLGSLIGFSFSLFLGLYFGFDTKIGAVILIISPVLLIKSLTVIDSYFQSIKKNKYPSIANIISIILGSIFIYVFIKLKLNLRYFALVFFIEALILVICLLFFYQRKIKLKQWTYSKKIKLSILKESWPLIIAGFASVVNTRIDQIFIGSMLSSNELGNYSAAAKISEFWLIFPTILSVTLYPVLINLRSTNYRKYKKFIFTVIITCLSFGIIFSINVSTFSETIIQFLFGKKYDLAGDYLSLYIWSTLPYFSLFILNSVTYLENLIKKNLIISIFSILSNLILNYYLINLFGAIGAIYATLIVLTVSYLLLGFFIFNYTNFIR